MLLSKFKLITHQGCFFGVRKVQQQYQTVLISGTVQYEIWVVENTGEFGGLIFNSPKFHLSKL